MNKSFLVLLSMLFIIGFVASAPPVTTVQQFNTGYVIRVPLDDYVKVGEDHRIKIHVYNITNGYPVNNSIICYLHFYGEDGHHLFELMQDTPDDIFDYSFDIGGGNLTEGYYWYNAGCHNGGEGGYGNGDLIANNNGEEPEGDFTRFGFSLIFILIFGLFLVVMLNTISKLGKVETTLKDVGYSYGLYFGMLAFWLLSDIYISSVVFNDYVGLMVGWLIFPLLVLPPIGWILTLVKDFGDAKTRSLEW